MQQEGRGTGRELVESLCASDPLWSPNDDWNNFDDFDDYDDCADYGDHNWPLACVPVTYCDHLMMIVIIVMIIIGYWPVCQWPNEITFYFHDEDHDDNDDDDDDDNETDDDNDVNANRLEGCNS